MSLMQFGESLAKELLDDDDDEIILPKRYKHTLKTQETRRRCVNCYKSWSKMSLSSSNASA